MIQYWSRPPVNYNYVSLGLNVLIHLQARTKSLPLKKNILFNTFYDIAKCTSLKNTLQLFIKSEDTNQQNESDNCISKIASRSPSGQWVNIEA